MTQSPRFRDLALIRRSPGSPRIFDLALMIGRGLEEAFTEGFFDIPRLNRTLIIKHTLRAHERAEIGAARRTATKIVFPIELSDLSLGGAGLFVEEMGFTRKLGAYLSGADGADEHFGSDLKRLRLLSELPMFDRFLLRERCRMEGLGFPDALAQAGPGGDQAILNLLFAHIEALFFGATGSKDLARRIAEGFCFKVFSAEFAEYAERLNEFFGLDAEQMIEALFAWKCLIYQSEVFERARRDIAHDLRALLHSPVPAGVSDTDRTFCLEVRERCRGFVRGHHGALRLLFGEYKVAYDAFSRRRQPGPFIGFLKQAPDIAFDAGESLALLMHYSGFIRFRLEREKAMKKPADCIGFHQDLALSLAGEAEAPELAEV
ncbi:MAG: hypothetical protein AAFX09_05650 [Pseudomonadota bacterium]